MSTGFPSSAIDRLNAMKPGTGSQAITTSELSIDEELLVQKAGFRTVGLCLGSCMYHLGFQTAKLSTTFLARAASMRRADPDIERRHQTAKESE